MRFGQHKTPLGMDFNTPAYLLDITKRGMGLGLTRNRDFGLMYSGNLGKRHLSYDLGVSNPPGRSQATQYEDSQARVGTRERTAPFVRIASHAIA